MERKPIVMDTKKKAYTLIKRFGSVQQALECVNVVEEELMDIKDMSVRRGLTAISGKHLKKVQAMLMFLKEEPLVISQKKDVTDIIRLPPPHGSKLKAKLEWLATDYTKKHIGRNNDAQRRALEDIRLLTKVIETL